MKKAWRAPLRGAALLGLVLATAAPLAAQSEQVPLDRETLTQFARVHVAINDARDEFHGKVGRLHDEEGRRRAREELEAQLDQILTGNEMTQERYDQLLLAISLDGEARALFDQILVELEEEG